MAAMYTLNLKDFEKILQDGDPYPYYAVLLYPPLNGLNAKLHAYVTSHWPYLNSLTGDSCLLFALESPGQPIEEFRPEDVYRIARHLGAEVDNVPCLVFITDPRNQRQTIIQPLKPLFPRTDDVTDETFTEFFQSLQAILDRCVVSAAPEDRFDCLQSAFNRAFVLPARGRQTVASVVTVAGTITEILKPITALLGIIT
ncbi:MAG TPA: hypothetical protein VFZ25_18840 [Chloroflexota bacterium]|nr:hypothetical protein [Chloroflexota bacterium]